jgi:hypothetical protein
VNTKFATTKQAHDDEILSPWNRETLSPNTTKLYTGLWYRMRNRGSAEIWLSDHQASRCGRLLIEYVPAARSELVNRGLLACTQGSGEWLYEYVEQADPEGEDDSPQDIESGARQ